MMERKWHLAWTPSLHGQALQINSVLRKEMGMYGGYRERFTSAKKEAKSQKLARVKKIEPHIQSYHDAPL